MTEDDLRLEALAALPGSPADDIADNGFSAGVIGQIGKRRRRRAIMVGAAGSIGSAIAGAQATSFMGAMEVVDLGQQAGLLGALTPEALVTMGIASLAAVVALIVPSRV